jgi:hypothetical protein
MTACTERPRTNWLSRELRAQSAGEGQKGMQRVGSA